MPLTPHSFKNFANIFPQYYLCSSLNVVPLQVTGSGKTLAFVIPIIELLLKREEKLKKMQVMRKPTLNTYIYLPPVTVELSSLLDAQSCCTCCVLQVGALVVTPTRELALQISEVMKQFLQKFPQFT